MTKTKPTKASLIRQYLPEHMNMGPSELARLISEENPSLDKPVTPQEISTMRAKMVTPTPAPAKGTDLASVVENLKKAIDSVGKDQARRILDML